MRKRGDPIITTRAFWESKGNSQNSLAIVDRCCGSPPFRDAEVTYYSTMTSVGPADWHWCWFKPNAGRHGVDCVIEPRVQNHDKIEVQNLLENSGVSGWKWAVNRPAGKFDTIHIPLAVEHIRRPGTWSCIERILAVSVTRR